MYDDDFTEGQPSQDVNVENQDAIASSQAHATQEAELHIAKATDHRDFDAWAADESFCQQFLTDRPREWRTAIERYWRERCTRRELANDLGLSLETVKNLLRRIRKAAKDFQNGHIKELHREGQFPGRLHTRAEEYHRLTLVSRLKMFGQISGTAKTSGPLMEILDQSEALGTTSIEVAAHLIAEAEELKASVAKDDPFAGRPLFQNFTRPEPNYREDRRGRPRQTKPAEITPARKRGRPCKQVGDICDLRVIPIPPPIFLDGQVSQF
jgi:hypothetical protein